jgi:hypothetical protein
MASCFAEILEDVASAGPSVPVGLGHDFIEELLGVADVRQRDIGDVDDDRLPTSARRARGTR